MENNIYIREYNVCLICVIECTTHGHTNMKQIVYDIHTNCTLMHFIHYLCLTILTTAIVCESVLNLIDGAQERTFTGVRT